jgi:MFS family permease
VYAVHLGAAPATVGYYLSFSFLALAVGSLAAGWLSDRLQRRKLLFIAASVASVPTYWLMSRASSVWQMAVLTAIAWFLGGVGLALINTMAGLFAAETERGKVFGIMALTGPLGTLIGGLTIGRMADRWGYPDTFAALALFSCLWPLAGSLLQDKVVVRDQGAETPHAANGAVFGKGFYSLLLVGLAVAISANVGSLGRSLAMNGLGFTAAAISSTAAVGGAVTLPLGPLVGWLSDRLGRKWLLSLAYIPGTVGLLALALATALTHFWIATTLILIMGSIHTAVGRALVTDLVPETSLGKGISLFSAAAWAGGIVGFAGSGEAVQHLGTSTTLAIGAVLPLIALLLLIQVRESERGESAAELAAATAR